MPSSRASICNSAFHKRKRFPYFSVGAAAVGIDEQLAGFGVALLPQVMPPAPNALDRERGRVGAEPDIDPAHVVDHVMDNVGDRLAEFLVRKVKDANLFGGPFRAPHTARIPEIPHQFLLPYVHGDHRLSGFSERRDVLVDVVELRIPVRMARFHR